MGQARSQPRDLSPRIIITKIAKQSAKVKIKGTYELIYSKKAADNEIVENGVKDSRYNKRYFIFNVATQNLLQAKNLDSIKFLTKESLTLR